MGSFLEQSREILDRARRLCALGRAGAASARLVGPPLINLLGGD